METILKEWCPKCKKHAYYNLGNLGDLTQSDMDGMRCPWCEHQWLWEGTEAVMMLEGRDLEDANIVVGQKELT